jgi:hypothetical protein
MKTPEAAAGAASAPVPAPARPTLRIVRGDASPEEIAAIVALLGARGGQPETPLPRRSAWADPSSALRRPPPVPTPGAWARSGLEPGVRTRAGW